MNKYTIFLTTRNPNTAAEPWNHEVFTVHAANDIDAVNIVLDISGRLDVAAVTVAPPNFS